MKVDESPQIELLNREAISSRMSEPHDLTENCAKKHVEKTFKFRLGMLQRQSSERFSLDLCFFLKLSCCYETPTCNLIVN